MFAKYTERNYNVHIACGSTPPIPLIFELVPNSLRRTERSSARARTPSAGMHFVPEAILIPEFRIRGRARPRHLRPARTGSISVSAPISIIVLIVHGIVFKGRGSRLDGDFRHGGVPPELRCWAMSDNWASFVIIIVFGSGARLAPRCTVEDRRASVVVQADVDQPGRVEKPSGE